MSPHERGRGMVKNFARRLGWTALAGTVLTGGGVAAVYTPDTSPTPAAFAAANGYEISPGWIERNGSAPFLQINKGHFYWMREKINNNPILFDLTKDFFKYLVDHVEKGERLRLGDALAFNILQAREKIQATNSSHIEPNTNLHLEIVRAALFPLAAGFTGQWWTGEDIEAFGVNIASYKDIDDFHWGPRGIGTVAYPKLFGINRKEPKESPTDKVKNSGQDRAIHFSHHTFITFEFLYAKMYGLPEDESMPYILRLIIPHGSPQEEARDLSMIAGYGYELSGLKDPKNWPINGRTPETIVEGVFDDMVTADLKGNELGSRTAIALFDRARKYQSIDDIIAQLNDSRYADYETSPTLNLPR